MQGRKAEIRSFLPISKNDIQESGNGKQGGNFTVGSRCENGCQQGGEQVIEKASENAARTIPKCLTRQFFDAAQRIGNFSANVIVA